MRTHTGFGRNPYHLSVRLVRARYGQPVLPLGFKFDVDAVPVAGMAHRQDCGCLPNVMRDDAVSVAAGGIHLTERRPRACPRCRPGFETLLSHQFQAAC